MPSDTRAVERGSELVLEARLETVQPGGDAAHLHLLHTAVCTRSCERLRVNTRTSAKWVITQRIGDTTENNPSQSKGIVGLPG
jgi:hypothetical protein